MARPTVSALPRPIRPHPRRFYPIVYGTYGYGYGYGLAPWEFGFGFPFFGFDNWGWIPSGSTLPPQAFQPTMLLYLTDGSAYEVTDYWVTGETLNYVADEGKLGAISLTNLDLQRTTDANAQLGLRFSLGRTTRGGPFERIEPPAPQRPSRSQP